MTTFSIIQKQLAENPELIVCDLSMENYREYEHGGVVYRITAPVALIMRKGGTTHRIVDCNNVTHCHPIPGNGCALRWFNGKEGIPVSF